MSIPAHAVTTAWGRCNTCNKVRTLSGGVCRDCGGAITVEVESRSVPGYPVSATRALPAWERRDRERIEKLKATWMEEKRLRGLRLCNICGRPTEEFMQQCEGCFENIMALLEYAAFASSYSKVGIAWGKLRALLQAGLPGTQGVTNCSVCHAIMLHEYPIGGELTCSETCRSILGEETP